MSEERDFDDNLRKLRSRLHDRNSSASRADTSRSEETRSKDGGHAGKKRQVADEGSESAMKSKLKSKFEDLARTVDSWDSECSQSDFFTPVAPSRVRQRKEKLMKHDLNTIELKDKENIDQSITNLTGTSHVESDFEVDREQFNVDFRPSTIEDRSSKSEDKPTIENYTGPTSRRRSSVISSSHFAPEQKDKKRRYLQIQKTSLESALSCRKTRGKVKEFARKFEEVGDVMSPLESHPYRTRSTVQKCQRELNQTPSSCYKKSVGEERSVTVEMDSPPCVDVIDFKSVKNKWQMRIDNEAAVEKDVTGDYYSDFQDDVEEMKAVSTRLLKDDCKDDIEETKAVPIRLFNDVSSVDNQQLGSIPKDTLIDQEHVRSEMMDVCKNTSTPLSSAAHRMKFRFEDTVEDSEEDDDVQCFVAEVTRAFDDALNDVDDVSIREDRSEIPGSAVAIMSRAGLCAEETDDDDDYFGSGNSVIESFPVASVLESSLYAIRTDPKQKSAGDTSRRSFSQPCSPILAATHSMTATATTTSRSRCHWVSPNNNNSVAAGIGTNLGQSSSSISNSRRTQHLPTVARCNSETECSKLGKQKNEESDMRTKMLEESLRRVELSIDQAAAALRLCASSNFEFSDRIESGRIMLSACHRKQAIMEEIARRNKVKKDQLISVVMPTASISISNIILPLREDYMNALAKGEDRNIFYVTCFVHYRSDVMQTTLCSTPEILLTSSMACPYMIFTNHVTFDQVDPDFEIKIYIYCLEKKIKGSVRNFFHQLRSVKPKGSMRRILPAIKNTYAASSRQEASRLVNFVQADVVSITKDNLDQMKYDLKLSSSRFPFTGKLQCTAEARLNNTVQHSGFLTYHTIISGLGAWQRNWCLLDNDKLSMWKNPEDFDRSQTNDPHVILYLQQSTTVDSKARMLPFDECARSFTMEILLKDTPDESGLTRHWFAADNRMEAREWCHMMNSALLTIQCWPATLVTGPGKKQKSPINSTTNQQADNSHRTRQTESK